MIQKYVSTPALDMVIGIKVAQLSNVKQRYCFIFNELARIE